MTHPADQPPPAPEPEPAPQRLRREADRLDLFLAALVLVFAGMLASFSVRNTDFWLHLDQGRRILSGHPSFGVDPYSYTTTGLYWANSSWLYGVILNLLAQVGGGPENAAAGFVLVGAKALLIAAMAFLMMSTRRPEQGLWAPALCTALALLAMSPRFLLQPMLVSACFLALTVFILQRPRPVGTAPVSYRVYWWLPAVFFLWANLDEWFLLGPLTVFLFLLGQSLQRAFMPVRTGDDAPARTQLGVLVSVLLAGLAVCLVNPHHYHVFQIPSLLSPSLPEDLIHGDPRLRDYMISPFDPSYYRSPPGNIAAFAYLPLLVVSVGSFVLSMFSGWRWWRVLLWSAFCAGSAYNGRLILFFGVVAAPIAALNIQDFARHQFGSVMRLGRGWKLWAIGGRLVTCLGCVILLLMAWPGWLHGVQSDQQFPHRVAFQIDVDPSLKAAAQQLAQWQARGVIPAGAHLFNVGPDTEQLLAWFLPDQDLGKGFCDYRFSLYPKKVVSEYLEIRRAFRDNVVPRGGSTRDWDDAFRQYDVLFAILHEMSPPDAWAGMMRDANQWKPVFMDGKTTIFQWIAGKTRDKNVGPPRLDPDYVAFASSTPRAPAEGPRRGPQRADIWQRYLEGVPPRPLQVATASQYSRFFQSVQMQWSLPYVVASEVVSWNGVAGNVACAPTIGTGLAPLRLALHSQPFAAVLFGLLTPAEFESPLAMIVGRLISPQAVANNPQEAQAYAAFRQSLHTPGQFGNPGALLLAIRFCRQALAANPDDADAYLVLAGAYDDLWHQLEERWGSGAPGVMRQVLRQAQLVAALEHTLKLKPNDVDAHRALMVLYEHANFHDLRLEHLNAWAALHQAAGPRPGESADKFAKTIEAIGTEQRRSDEDVKKRRSSFESAARNRPLIEKAQLALQQGLGQTALTTMLEADAGSLGPSEVNLLLDLLLRQGRPEDMDQLLRPEFRRTLGFSYDWNKAVAAAALGNYAEAAKNLNDALETTNVMLVDLALKLGVNQTFQGLTPATAQNQDAVVQVRRQQADLLSLRGFLALEEGDTAGAQSALEQALSLGEPTFNFSSRPIALEYLTFLKKTALPSEKD